MESNPVHTAVLLFTRTSSQEAQVKQFTRSRGKNKAITTRLIDQTKRVVRQAELPLIVVNSTQQTGTTFGERLKNAIQQVFSAGYEKVICLGNDSPGLTPALLRIAAAKLQQQDYVFGRASDGGVYLIGLDRSAFPKLDFAAISWQSAQVFEELCRQTVWAQVTVLAPILQDADDAVAIYSISNTYILGGFSRFLKSLLPLPAPNIHQFISFLSSATPAIYGLRGPPVI